MTTITQSCPGTIQLANMLSAGIAAESVAYAKMGQALNTYSDHMSAYAQDGYKQGQQMIKVEDVMQWVQYASTAVLALTVVGGCGAAFAGVAQGVGASISSAANGVGQGLQGALGLAQGGMQAYKSGLQAATELDSTATAAFGKTSEMNSNTIKSESQGAGKIGSAISTMLHNEGAVERQKITK
jgi:hypothetical protein